MARQISSEDNYRDKLIKLIPAEIVAAYLMLQANLLDQGRTVVWIVIGVLFILTFLYLRFFGEVKKWLQLIFSSLSFLIWVYSIAPEEILGPDLHNPSLATIILVLWTLLIPFFFKQGDPS